MNSKKKSQNLSPGGSPHSRFSIASFNAHGVRGKEPEIEALASKFQVLAVCETWIRPQDIVTANKFEESVTVVQTHNGWRGQGGIGFRINPLLNYTLVQKHAQVSYQYIIIQVGGINIAAVYLTPTISQCDFRACLSSIQSCVIGPVVIIGDLNCRHKKWDTKSNKQGGWLVEWVSKNGWTIQAPSEPTFAAHSGKSTVDLMLTKGVNTSGLSVIHGSWDGCSDHLAVCAQVMHCPSYRLDVPRIPQRQRTNTVYSEKAQKLYKSELPKIQDQILSCKTGDELEQLYSEFKQITLGPWEPARKPRRKSFKYFWNRHLEYLKGVRSKKYKLAVKEGTENAWMEYRKVDRRIRYLVNTAKRKARLRQAETLTSSDPKDGAKTITAILRSLSQQSTQDKNDGSTLKLSDFTTHLSDEGMGHSPRIEPFSLTRKFILNVTSAIRRAKSNKATGVDELFSESFKMAPRLFGEILARFWVRCSQLNYLIQDWNTGLLVPLHKKGAKADPGNHRPVALLSHGRQMISSAIGAMVRKEYKFHTAQLGFREHTGTETAVVRHAAASEDGLIYTAVLDLKSAYPSVPRDKLMKIVRERLPKETASMIALELQPMAITTKGDKSGTTGIVSIGVPTGGSSSPPLYNIFQDPLAEMVEARFSDEQVRITLFCDDVKIQAVSSRKLQEALDVATEWAKQAGMTWSIKKCHILEPEGVKFSGNYYLAGEQIGVKESAEYLGVTLRGTTLAVDKNLNRVKAAVNRLNMLKAAGITRKYLPSSRLIDICRTYVYPVADYATHLVPMGTEEGVQLVEGLEMLDYKVAEHCLGCIAKKPSRKRSTEGRIAGRLPRHLKMARLPDWLQRIRMKLHSLRTRLRIRSRKCRDDAKAKADPLHLVCLRDKIGSPKEMTRKDVTSAWKKLCGSRKIPTPEKGSVPVLSETDQKVRDAGIRWYTGAFPGEPDIATLVLGAESYRKHKSRMDHGMRLETWSEGERKKTTQSIKALVEGIEKYWNMGMKKRRLIGDDEGDEDWSPKRAKS